MIKKTLSVMDINVVLQLYIIHFISYASSEAQYTGMEPHFRLTLIY